MKEIIAYLIRKIFKKSYGVDPGIKVYEMAVAEGEDKVRVTVSFDITKESVKSLIDAEVFKK